MEAATTVNGTAVAERRQGGWTPPEENLLYRIVRSENLSGRTTTVAWERIADRLAAQGASLGFHRRSASSVRHRAAKIGAYSCERTSEPVNARDIVESTYRSGQRSFAAPEVKAEVGRAFVAILRRIADELEKAHA